MLTADTPRPESIVDRNERAVLALEVPPCRCPRRMKVCVYEIPDPTPANPDRVRRVKWRYLPRCRHVDLADHNVDVDEWVKAMHERDPRGMAERPPPPFPTSNPLACKRELRVLIMAERRELGYALFHPLDYHQLPATETGVNTAGEVTHDRRT